VRDPRTVDRATVTTAASNGNLGLKPKSFTSIRQLPQCITKGQRDVAPNAWLMRPAKCCDKTEHGLGTRPQIPHKTGGPGTGSCGLRTNTNVDPIHARWTRPDKPRTSFQTKRFEPQSPSNQNRSTRARGSSVISRDA